MSGVTPLRKFRDLWERGDRAISRATPLAGNRSLDVVWHRSSVGFAGFGNLLGRWRCTERWPRQLPCRRRRSAGLDDGQVRPHPDFRAGRAALVDSSIAVADLEERSGALFIEIVPHSAGGAIDALIVGTNRGPRGLILRSVPLASIVRGPARSSGLSQTKQLRSPHLTVKSRGQHEEYRHVRLQSATRSDPRRQGPG
jgi:hypothetical protein